MYLVSTTNWGYNYPPEGGGGGWIVVVVDMKIIVYLPVVVISVWQKSTKQTFPDNF